MPEPLTETPELADIDPMPPAFRVHATGCEQLSLDRESLGKATRLVTEGLHALAFIRDQIESRKSENGLDIPLIDIAPAMSVVEHKWADLATLMSVPSAVAREVEERHAALREANTMIRSLEEKLGGELSGTQVQCSLRDACGALRKWWRSCGFAHISSINFGEYSCEVELSLMCPELDDLENAEACGRIGRGQVMATWRERMGQRGLVLVNEDGGRDYYVRDCDASTAALEGIISAGLASASIREKKTRRMYGSAGLCVNGLVISIRSIEDIWAHMRS
ncbi:hypothetical protein ACMAUO_20550 [Gluconacetobacter sp. Hr-1-5]|uniref:hypothetical protein n=1 Tax=Gluconacetobacter sp. Hr-1-5 TaxID=3395370 RepID=UPI003B51E9A9